MAAYPDIVEYNATIQHPATAFFDSELKKGQVKENILGLPTVLSGGFALTYMITTPQREFAVRCFHRQIPSVDQKYAAISQKIEALKSKYFVEFNYLKQGIKVRGGVYPIVKMAWVEGDPLGIWLDKNHGNSVAVESVRQEFAYVAKFLEHKGIAHGDIQNGNVMISPTGITLIDYDGMYVPAMATGNGSETGHKHFQHPCREAKHFGPTMDRFSFIALDLSLRAVIEDPSLYKRFREGGETIIFRANDFVDPQCAPIFDNLRQNPRLKIFADNFSTICRSEITAIPTLEDFLGSRNIPTVKTIWWSPGSEFRAAQPRTATYIGPYPVLSTDDYAGVMQRVGQRIELIGRIHAVKRGAGKRGRGRGKPYIFVNFGNWLEDIVKLTIWSEGLSQLRELPDNTWIDRWISVTGLVDAPYSGRHYNRRYTHVGIIIESPQQLNVIPEREAKFRLGQITVSPNSVSCGVKGGPGIPSPAELAQQNSYEKAKGRRDVITAEPRGSGSPNRRIVDNITKRGASTAPSGQVRPVTTGSYVNLSPADVAQQNNYRAAKGQTDVIKPADGSRIGPSTPVATPFHQPQTQADTNQDILRRIRQAPSTPATQPIAPPAVSPTPAQRTAAPTSPPIAPPLNLFRRMLRLFGVSR